MLTLKELGFFLPAHRWGVLVFSTPLCKIRSRHSRELKLTELIAYNMFYKIGKFESSTITKDVIMTSLPKQWQNLDLRETKQIVYCYPNMYFLLNLSRCVKSYGYFVKFWLSLRCPFTKYGHVT